MQQYTDEVEQLVCFAFGFGTVFGALGFCIVFFVLAKAMGLP